MQKNFDEGYTSRVADPSTAKYFLAHHGVYKGKKLRVDFDAAAPLKRKCLNAAIISVLDSGPLSVTPSAGVTTLLDRCDPSLPRREDCLGAGHRSNV